MSQKNPRKAPFQWTSFEYEIHDRKYHIVDILDKDVLFDQILDLEPNHPFVEDERIPYWADLWPSSIGMSQYLLSHPELCNKKSVLEIGAGMGLCGLVAQQLGAHVILTDYLEEAFKAAKILWELNQMPPPVCQKMDIRIPDLSLTADLLLASDVIYEDRLHVPLIDTFNKLSHRSTQILMSEPQRKYSRNFFKLLDQEGFFTEKTEYSVSIKSQKYRIAVYLIYKSNSKE